MNADPTRGNGRDHHAAAPLMKSFKILPRGLWHGPPTRRGLVCDDSRQPRRRGVSDSNNKQKRELECLRLASDLRQLSKETLDPHFRAHCLRMADVWTDLAARGLTDDPAPPDGLVH